MLELADALPITEGRVGVDGHYPLVARARLSFT
jgi:hypothetical protein